MRSPEARGSERECWPHRLHRGDPLGSVSPVVHLPSVSHYRARQANTACSPALRTYLELKMGEPTAVPVMQPIPSPGSEEEEFGWGRGTET